MIASNVQQRISWLLFAAAFVSFAYFHQGGGWNQNVRFAMIRSIVEEGTFSIDSYLVYTGAKSDQGTRLVRVPVSNAEFSLADRDYAFQWRDVDGRTVPLNVQGENRNAGRAVTYVEPEQVAVSGDVSFFHGHFHPAKAPGGAFIAVPGYFIIYHIERIFGMDPDDWWTLTVNAWLASVLSIGLVSAVGCVIFYRLALKLSEGRSLESLLASLAFAFGTMFFPYATTLFEHDLIAVALLTSFYLLCLVKGSFPAPGAGLSRMRTRLYIFLAGLCSGYAVITNYIMAAVALLLFCYLIIAVRHKGGWQWFALGALGPLLLLFFYNIACFSALLTTNYHYENPAFKTGGNAFLDVFLWPRWNVLLMALFSPYRGLFISAPALLLGVYGLSKWLRSGKLREEAWLIVTVFVFFLVFISSFNGWHGGWAVGPRYLVPALPFLALPAVYGFARFFRTACVLAALSVSIGFLVTAVDPQSPVGNAGSALVEDRPQWQYSPLTEWEWPLFVEGHAWPLFRAQRERVLRYYDGMMQAGGEPAQVRNTQIIRLQNEIDGAVIAGDPAPLLLMRGPDGRPGAALSELPTFVGPVSVNPMGIYEGWIYRVFPLHSSQTAWNSFNAGEFLFEKSRWSLMPLIIAAGSMAVVMIRLSIRSDAERRNNGAAAAGSSPV